MLIIGITGTLGAGKGTIVEYLKKERNFIHYSVRAYLLDVIRQRNLPENRDSMVSVANELRKKNAPSFIIDELFEIAKNNDQNAIIESIRTPGEVDSLRQKSKFILLAVDADPKIRYERIKLRNSETDHIDYSTFIENEKREMTTDDPNKQNLRKCIDLADFVIMNNGSIMELHDQIDLIISNFDNK
ncbi:MAG: AAA family ATPase [Bacteroidales bacterium]